MTSSIDMHADRLTRTLESLAASLAENARIAAELRSTREQLRACEAQQRDLFARAPLPMFAYDRETLEIAAVSDAASEAYGYTRAEFLAMTINDIRPAADVAGFLGDLESVAGRARLGTSPRHPWRHQRKDGTVVEVEIDSNDLTLGGRDCRIVLCQDVSDRNRLAGELARERLQAEQRRLRRSRILSNVSHELRTPMNGVVGMNELLLDTPLSREQRDYAEHVSSAADQMVAVVDDLLDIAEIETGQAVLEPVDFCLHETIEQACTAARFEASGKGLGLELVIDPEVPPYAHGDLRRLRKIIQQLVSNAVKFTAEGRIAVHVSADRLQDGAAIVHVEVSDSGIGIDPVVLESLYGAFVQGDASMTRRYEGAGLGLAIARAFAELMGGSIGSESEVGLGSTFWLELPLEQAAEHTRLRPQPQAFQLRRRHQPSSPAPALTLFGASAGHGESAPSAA